MRSSVWFKLDDEKVLNRWSSFEFTWILVHFFQFSEREREREKKQIWIELNQKWVHERQPIHLWSEQHSRQPSISSQPVLLNMMPTQRYHRTIIRLDHIQRFPVQKSCQSSGIHGVLHQSSVSWTIFASISLTSAFHFVNTTFKYSAISESCKRRTMFSYLISVPNRT